MDGKTAQGFWQVKKKYDKMTHEKEETKQSSSSETGWTPNNMYFHAGRQMKGTAHSSAQGQKTENESCSLCLTLKSTWSFKTR